MKKWKCGVCGYIYEGQTPPERCPVCGAPEKKSAWITGDEADADHEMHGHSGHDHMAHSQQPHSHEGYDHAARQQMHGGMSDRHQTNHSEMNHSGSHADHHAGMVADFMKRFWVALVLTLPITILSEMIQMLFGYELHFGGSNILLFVLSTVIFVYGGKPFLKGAREELKAKKPAMMMLISLAIISAYFYSTLTTFFIEGSEFYFELATLILIMLLGHWIEMKSQMGASKALEELIKLMPKDAHKLDEHGNIVEVSVEALVPQDRILVKSGEKIPLDGRIFEGQSTVDESMLTGESAPIDKTPGMKVIGGSINGNGVLKIIVEKVGDETYLAQVIKTVNEAQKQKTRTQGLADRTAKWLFYIAVTVGIITLVYWLFNTDMAFALERMVTVLVIACPHALGLAVPLVNSVGTAIAARKGLLIRNRIQFENARKIGRIVFDKTGTLTEGQFGVTDIIPEASYEQGELLSLAYSIEAQSDHPIAKGIVRKAKEEQVPLLTVTDSKTIAGEGLEARIGGAEVAIISPGGMKARGIPFAASQYDQLAGQGKTVVFVLRDNKLLGMIGLADIIRKSSYDVIKELERQHIESIMISGDNHRVAEYVGGQLKLSKVYAQVLPHEKSRLVKELKASHKKVAMVGDGINDAPALAEADLGIAIGAGTDVAIETADVILVNSDPKDVLNVLKLSKASYRKMVQNLVWAVGYNVVAIPLAAGILVNYGIVITPAIGAVMMSASTIICAINARTLTID